jgi:NADH-quinone oxidoreductase subunit J
MVYALLAATALGAIGLHLMLPRERAPLARLGFIMGAMALAGFFLFLVNQTNVSKTGGPPVYFYIFAAIMIGGAVGVVCQPRPVYAALYFVLITLAGAGMFVLLLAEFMAIVLIIIYAGAILVTYVFVIMLASQGSTGGSVTAPAYDRRSASAFPAVFASFVLIGAVLQVLLPTPNSVIATPHLESPGLGIAGTRDPLMARNLDDMPATTLPAEAGGAGGSKPTNVQVLGANLYSRYSLSLELAGVLLTIALVGAVVISRKNTHENQPLGSGQLPAE